ncbi:tetratricopeptide repeat protein [Aquirufa sp. ROCK2-A2]
MKYILLIIWSFVLLTACSTDKDKKEASDFFLRGNQKLKEKEYFEAIKWFGEAINKQKGFSDAYYNRGLCFQALEKNEEALKDFSLAFDLDSKFSPALFKKVEILQSLEQFDLATEEANKLVQAFPDSAANHRLKGDVLFQKKELTNSLASYEIALKIDSNLVEALINKGVVLQEMNELDLAEATFQKALTKNKYKDLIYNNLGYLSIQKKQWKLAHLWVTKALKMSPENELYLKNLAKIEEQSSSN